MNPAMNAQPNITPMYPGIHQADETEEGPNLPTAPLNTLLGFDLETYQIPLDTLMPSKRIPDGVMSTRKYKQVVSSIHEIGLIEPLSVIQHDPTASREQQIPTGRNARPNEGGWVSLVIMTQAGGRISEAVARIDACDVVSGSTACFPVLGD